MTKKQAEHLFTSKIHIKERSVKMMGDMIRSEGKYRQYKNYDGSPACTWVLVEWRVSINDEDGEWHKVHGRQRKPIAGFDLEVFRPDW